MAVPIILVNSSSGSDTAASGAGPSTALTGTAAATSGTGLVVTLDGSPDLTNVATDGSHVVWVQTASGRQFAAITAKDNSAKTVTTATAFAINLTGKAWAIGGKRATLDNADTRKLFSADAASGWIVDLQEAGSSYVLTSTLNIAASGFALTSSTTNYPTITTATNSVRLITYTAGCFGMYLSHIKFATTATTRLSALFPSGATANNHVVRDCIFDGFVTAIDGSNGAGQTFPNLTLDLCEFLNCTVSCVTNASNGASVTLTTATDCFFHDNSASGTWVFANCAALTIERCVFTRNRRCVNGATSLVLRNCAIHGSTDTTLANAAITVASNSNNEVVEATGNIFYGNVPTALLVSGDAGTPVCRVNAYGSNGANLNGLAAGTGDITLTADPFTNAAGNDFTLNSTAGGGALLKGVINNAQAHGLAGTGHGDVGPFQSAGSAGASGVPPAPIQPGSWSYFG